MSRWDNRTHTFLSPTIRISREKLLEAIDHAELLAAWLQQQLEEHRYLKWTNRQAT